MEAACGLDIWSKQMGFEDSVFVKCWEMAVLVGSAPSNQMITQKEKELSDLMRML